MISLKVPQDIVDVELFVKMTKGHFGILMDPWSSSSWRKYWSQQHTPNKITKEKIWCLQQVKAERRISLYRMAGQSLMKRLTWKTALPQYNPRAEGLLEQNDPQPKGAGKIQRKLNRVRFKSRPRKRQRPMSEEDEETDPTIIVSSDEDGQKAQEEEHTREEEPPQSPPEEEKGNLPYSYTPRSPPYSPPEDDDWETESLPRLVTSDEDQDTAINQGRKSPEVPADQDADKDFFQDSERQSAVQQKYGSEIKQAPWNPQANSDNPLMKLGDMIHKATPVYDGFLKNNNSDILSRLDVASEELKDKRSSTQREAPDESSPNEQDKLNVEEPHSNRPESPSLLMSTRNDLRNNLEDAISNAPVEPVTPQTGPPKVIPPMPYSEHNITVPPPLEIPPISGLS